MQQKNGYSLQADILRVFSAFFVVFSHTTDVFVTWPLFKNSVSWDIVYYLNTLSRVAVPVFILLSGYLVLRPEKFKTIGAFYKRRLGRVVFPFIFWLPIYFWWRPIYWDQTHLTLQKVLGMLWEVNIWHLYFLVILIELYLFAPILIRFIKTHSRRSQTLVFLCLMLLSILLAVWANIPSGSFDVTKNIVTIFVPYIFYFYAGGYLRTKSFSVRSVLGFFSLYLFLGVLTNLIAKGNVSDFIIFNYSPTLISMSICFALGILNLPEIPLFKSTAFRNILLYLSSTTFGIYLVHFLILDLVRKYFHLYPWEIHAPLVLYAILPALLTFAISFIIIAIVKKLPYSWYIVG